MPIPRRINSCFLWFSLARAEPWAWFLDGGLDWWVGGRGRGSGGGEGLCECGRSGKEKLKSCDEILKDRCGGGGWDRGDITQSTSLQSSLLISMICGDPLRTSIKAKKVNKLSTRLLNKSCLRLAVWHLSSSTSDHLTSDEFDLN